MYCAASSAPPLREAGIVEALLRPHLTEVVAFELKISPAVAMTGTSSSIARLMALPIAPDELCTCSNAGETFSKNSTAPSAASTEFCVEPF